MGSDFEVVVKYFEEAEVEYKQEHYHLVIGNLMYALHCLDELGEDEEWQGKIYLLLCKTHLKLKHLEKAQDFWERCFNFYSESDSIKVAELYYLQGLIYAEENKTQKAIMNYSQALGILEGDNSEEALEIRFSALYNMSNSFLRKGDYDKALDGFRKLYKLIRTTQKTNLKGKVFLGIGYVYHCKDKLRAAQRMYKLALNYIKAETDSISYGRAAHNLGEVYLARNLKELARPFFEESVRKSEDYKVDKGRVVASYCGLAFTYLNDDMAKVKHYCIEALNLAMNGLAARFSTREEQDLGRVFLLLCNWLHHEGKYTEMSLYLPQAEKIFSKYKMERELNELNQFKNQARGGEPT